MLWNFKQAFDRLTEAYIKGDVNPFNSCNCFVGNLLAQDYSWSAVRVFLEDIGQPKWDSKIARSGYFYNETFVQTVLNSKVQGFYTPKDILELEGTFLATYLEHGGQQDAFYGQGEVPTLTDEEALFKAFDVTLDLLREIHEKKGEKVDGYKFTKRELV